MRGKYWPFSKKSAFLATLILVPLSVAAVIWLASDDVAGFEVSPWILVAAVIVGLLPVILVVLSGVGSVEAAGVKVAFAAVQEVVAGASDVDTRSLLAQNLGQPPGQVQEDSETVIETLGNAIGNEVVEIALEEGEAWWETRLLLLASGAARLRNPRAVAFTWATPDRPRTFIGWARPEDIRRRLLAANDAFRLACEKAERDTLLHRLSLPDAPGATQYLPWAPAGKAVEVVPEGRKPSFPGAVKREGATDQWELWELPWPSFEARPSPSVRNVDSFLPERLLLEKLAPLETGDSNWRITESRIRDLLGSVLFTAAVDRDESEDRWVATIVGSTAEYFAVTSGGQLVTLVPRSSAVNAVLLTLLRGRDSRGG